MTQNKEGGRIAMALPLEGILIVDLSQRRPGPWCSMVLADFGAEVIKVEEPVRGDYSRWAPPFVGGESFYFLGVNRNKKSVAIDLRQPAGKELLKRLAQRADVLLENFRPGVMDRLGLGYAQLEQLNPRLIYCAITAFGQTGPYRDYPAHDLNTLGLAGGLYIPMEDGQQEPTRSGVSVGDFAGGVTGVIGILLALAAREKTSRGQFVDAAMLDGIISFENLSLGQYILKRGLAKGNSLPGRSPRSGIYKTKDGEYVSFGAVERHFWERFCKVVGREDMFDPDETDADRVSGGERREETAAFLKEVFLTRTRDEWVRTLQAADVPCFPVHRPEDVFDDPHVRHRQMVMEMDHPKAGRILQIGFPVKLSETPGQLRAPPPSMGQHTDEILGWLGYSPEEIVQLRQQKVVR